MFALTFMNYAALHATRSIWSSATKDFITDYNFSEDTIAYMNICFLTAYAFGATFLSQFADQFPKKQLIIVQYTIVAMIMCVLGSLSFVDKSNQHSILWVYYCIKICNGMV